jgi:hypothetical protein
VANLNAFEAEEFQAPGYTVLVGLGSAGYWDVQAGAEDFVHRRFVSVFAFDVVLD